MKNTGKRDSPAAAQIVADLAERQESPPDPLAGGITPEVTTTTGPLPEFPPTALLAKLSLIMGEVTHVEKKGRNEFHKYDYATIADVIACVRTAFIKHRLVLIPEVLKVVVDPVGDKGDHITRTTMLMHIHDAESGQSLSRVWEGHGTDKLDKGIFKAYSGSLKYFFQSLLLLPFGDDPEKDNKGEQNGGTLKASQLRPGKPAAKPADPEQDPRLVTPPQLKRLRFKQHAAEMPDDILKELIVSHGFDSSKAITKKTYPDIVAQVEEYGAQEVPPDEGMPPEAEG